MRWEYDLIKYIIKYSCVGDLDVCYRKTELKADIRHAGLVKIIIIKLN